MTMSVDQFPLIASFAPKCHFYGAKFANSVNRLAKATEEGEILKNDYEDIKGVVGAVVEFSWQQAVDVPFTFAGKYQERSVEEMDLVHAISFNLRSVNAIDKKLAKFDGETQMVAAMRAVIAEAKPLADAIAALKDKIVKAKAKKSADELLKERFDDAAIKGKAISKVKAALNAAVDEDYRWIRDSLVEQQNTAITAFRAQTAEPNPTKFFTTETRVDRFAIDAVFVAGHFNYEGDTDGLVFGDDMAEIVANRAETMASRIRDQFVYKNLSKIDANIEKKGDLGEIIGLGHSVDIGGMRGSFKLTFMSGAEFVIINSVVFVINSYRTEFNRYPLTFTDVVNSDGTKMKVPSEAKMLKEFK